MAKGITMAGWLSLLICSLLVMNAHEVYGDTDVPITFLESAIPKGAVCLDGSAPAYSYVDGYGNGSARWIVFLEGGGWCYKLTDCYNRSLTNLGSSRYFYRRQTTFSALLDSNCTSNPDFCNWHKVSIHYCDGSSFMSDIMDSKSNLSFRGARIFNVMMEEMLAKGMRNAKQAVLTGSSAGGLATMLHCDQFRKLFPSASRVKCISDSGFFLNGKGLLRGENFRENYFAGVIKTHELAKALPPACTSKRNPDLFSGTEGVLIYQCLFPEYFAEDIQTPLFIIESAFDLFQLTSLVLGNNSCTNNLMSCNFTEVGIIRDFRTRFLKTLLGLKNSSTRGMFIHSCYLHAHFPDPTLWTCIKLANKGIIQAVGDWYFDRSSFPEIDTKHDFPQNCTDSICPRSLNKKSLASLPHSGLSFLLSSSLFLFVCHM